MRKPKHVKDKHKEIVLAEANILLDTMGTLREVSETIGRSKSIVHIDLRDRLPLIDSDLYERVSRVLAFNKKARSRRGGEATRRKYRGL